MAFMFGIKGCEKPLEFFSCLTVILICEPGPFLACSQWDHVLKPLALPSLTPISPVSISASSSFWSLFEYKPGNLQLIHHCNWFSMSPEEERNQMNINPPKTSSSWWAMSSWECVSLHISRSKISLSLILVRRLFKKKNSFFCYKCCKGKNHQWNRMQNSGHTFRPNQKRKMKKD